VLIETTSFQSAAATIFAPAYRLQSNEMMRISRADPQAACDRNAADGRRPGDAVAVSDTTERSNLIASNETGP
jgi:hypothetical protein